MKLLFTFALSVLTLGSLSAQTIPNNSFDNWAVTQLGYNDPVDWFTTNFMTGSVMLSAEPVTNSHSGAAAISLKNPSDGFGAFAISLFASHERPQALKGYFRYLPTLGDSASVMVALTKWDAQAGQSEAIGGAELKLGASNGTNWEEFQLPIQYTNAAAPDSIMIMIMASGMSNPQQGSVFMVDDLEFAAINGIADNQKPLNLNVYPNPTNGFAYVQLTEELAQAHQFQITDMLGRVVQAGHISPDMLAQNNLKLDAAALTPGMYQVQVTSDSRIATARLLVNR